MAPLSTVQMGLIIYLQMGLPIGLIWGSPALACWALAQKARREGNKRGYEYLHGLWHYLACFAACVAMGGGVDGAKGLLKASVERKIEALGI